MCWAPDTPSIISVGARKLMSVELLLGFIEFLCIHHFGFVLSWSCMILVFVTHCLLQFKQDEKEIQQSAFKQYRVLQSATRFRYGYKLVVMFLYFSRYIFKPIEDEFLESFLLFINFF
jgi:hypothetical protein